MKLRRKNTMLAVVIGIFAVAVYFYAIRVVLFK